MAGRARLLAEARHDWSAITPRLIDVYRHLISDLRPTSSVIATVRNEAQTVGAVISGVARQQPPPAEMVIVDGGSDDDTVRVIREYSSRQDVTASGLRVSVRSEPGANISRGRNLAVGSAVGSVIAAVDAGTVLASDWFSRLVAPFERDAGVGVVSGFFVGAPETDWERALAATTLPLVEDIDPVRFLPSSRSVAFRRTEFARAGDIRSGWTMVKTLYSTWHCVASASCSGFSLVLLPAFARARPQPRSSCSTTGMRVVMARQDYSRSGTPSGMAPTLEVWCSPWVPRTDD